MVNYGRPSRGCQVCKTRRIKCDLTRPACNRCVQSGRLCPGVPTDSELLFRNQTSLVKAKSQNIHQSKKENHQSDSSRTATPESQYSGSEDSVESFRSNSTAEIDTSEGLLPLANYSNTVQGVGIPKALAQPLESIAVPFYFHYFVPDPEKEKWMNPYMETLREMQPRARLNSCLSETTSAIAMAALTNYPDFKALRPLADQKYLSALKVTRNGLLHPNESKSDEVLMSTLLMSLYECMSSSDTAVESYKHHMDGAVALVRHRATRQFRDPVSLKLFRAVRTHYLLDCVHNSRSMETPEEGSLWLSDALYSSNPANNLYIHSIGIPTLRERAKVLLAPGQKPDRDEVFELIRDSRAMDAKLSEWANNLTDEWSWEVVPFSVSPFVEPEDSAIWPEGEVHRYFNFFISSVMNNYRCLRLYLQDIIARCVSWLDYSGQISGHSFLYQATVFEARKLVDAICASVPFHMGRMPDVQTDISNLKNMRQVKSTEALGSFYLIRPLSVALSVGCIPEEQRRWLRGRLTFMAYAYGFHRARLLANFSQPSILAMEELRQESS